MLKNQRIGLMSAAAAAALLVSGTLTPAAACDADSMIGSVCTFAFNFCPVGWLPTDGKVLATSGYAALYSLIGNNYGTSTQTSFSLPDLRGRVIAGAGQGTTLAPLALGQAQGTEQVTMTVANMPPHTHQATFASSGQAHVVLQMAIPAVSTSTATSDMPGTTMSLAKIQDGGLDATAYSTAAADTTLRPFAVNFSLSGQVTGTVTNAPTGGSVAFPIVNPQIALTTCINVKGVYPPRPW